MGAAQTLLSYGRLAIVTWVGVLLLSAVPVHAGLIHRYTFDGPEVTDSVGNANGTVVCGASVVDGALALNGGYVQIRGKLVPSNGTFTVMLFARETIPTPDYAVFVSQGTGFGPGFAFGHNPDNGIRVSDTWLATGVPFPTDGQWHHYAVTSDAAAGSSVLHVDGVERASVPRALPITAGGSDTRFGRIFSPGPLDSFFGPIADVQVWDEALPSPAVAHAAATRPGQVAGASTAPRGRWTNIGPCSFSGRVQAVAVDPRNVDRWLIGAAGGGVWETRDAGATWQPKTDDQASLAMGRIGFAPSNPDVVYAGTGEFGGDFGNSTYAGAGLLKSIDGTSTWTLLAPTTFAKTAFMSLRVHPANPDVVLAATAPGTVGRNYIGVSSPPPTGILKSVDGGVPWSSKLLGYGTDLDVEATNFNHQLAGIGHARGDPANGVYRSVDAGETWTRIIGPWDDALAGQIAVAIAPSNPNTAYVSIQRANVHAASQGTTLLGLFRTDNVWAPVPSWTQIPNVDASGSFCRAACSWAMVLLVDPTNANTLYAAGTFGGRTLTGAWECANCGASFTFGRGAFLWTPPAPPTVRVTLGGTGFLLGQTFALGLTVENPTGNFPADLYAGVLLPDGRTVVFLSVQGTPGGTASLDGPARLQPVQAVAGGASVDKPTFAQLTIPGTAPTGTYRAFAALVRLGALLDNRVDPADLLAVDVRVFTVAP
jgi:hypothetical protein